MAKQKQKKLKYPKDRVRIFALALSQELKKDYWGDIEPEVFENIAADCDSGDQLVYNKYSREEMESAIPSMFRAIYKALKVSDEVREAE